MLYTLGDRPLDAMLSRFALLAALLLAPALAFAQPPPPLPPEPSPIPVDGGLGLLALAGGAYAVRKLRHRKAED